MHKGQMFSMDFLIAAVIVIMAFGLLTAAMEINFYNKKQSQLYEVMKQKAQTAAIALVNSPDYDCNIGSLELAYSIDLNKAAGISESDFKNRLGLKDYNANISFRDLANGGNIIVQKIINDSITDSNNIASIDLNIAGCAKDIRPAYSDLNTCIRTPQGSYCSSSALKLYTMTVKVAK
ncbi:Uncharacterised protein [uncultured archaeon]|nr:Uncharacterised protein [uncultured archaeon]